MQIYQEFKKSFRSLLIHRLRTFLSTLGILFGVVAVIAMLSIGEGAKRETLEQIEQLGINNIIIRQHVNSEEQRSQALKQRSKGLTWRDVEALQYNLPYLLSSAPIKVIEASLTSSPVQLSPEILALTRHYGEMKGLELTEGRFICDLDLQNKRLVCVLGYEIAKSLGKDGHVGRTLRIENIGYEIVGVLKPMHWKASQNQVIAARHLDKAVLIPLGAEMSLSHSSSLPQDSLSEIILQIQHAKQLSVAFQITKKTLERLHGGYEDYQILLPQELLQQASRTQQTFNWVLGSIAAISLLVGGIGIMNIMLATVSERTREIGIRRALGANKRHILTQFLLETLLLTLAGALLGIILGIGLALTISYVAGWKTIVSIWSIFLSIIMSAVVGLGSGLYPAIQAATMDPIKALRHD